MNPLPRPGRRKHAGGAPPGNGTTTCPRQVRRIENAHDPKGPPDGWEPGTGTTGPPPHLNTTPEIKEAGAAEQVKLRGGAVVLIRPVEAADAPLLATAFERLGNTSRASRFLTAKPCLSAQELRALTDVDHYDHEALGALDTRDGRLLGVARYIRHAADPTSAEVAITVADEWQGRGLGGELIARLSRRAREDGIDRFTALVAPGNLAVARLLRGSGADVNVTTRDRYSIGYEIALAD